MPEPITSLQNDRIKAIARLEKRSERTARRLTVVEGVREVSHALATGVVPVEVYVCPELVGPESCEVVARLEELDAAQHTRLFTVTPRLRPAGCA